MDLEFASFTLVLAKLTMPADLRGQGAPDMSRLTRDIKDRGRDVQSVIEQYMGVVRLMHLEFVEPTKRYADVIIPEGGMNTVALNMVIARIEELLRAAVLGGTETA